MFKQNLVLQLMLPNDAALSVNPSKTLLKKQIPTGCKNYTANELSDNRDVKIESLQSMTVLSNLTWRPVSWPFRPRSFQNSRKGLLGFVLTN